MRSLIRRRVFKNKKSNLLRIPGDNEEPTANWREFYFIIKRW